MKTILFRSIGMSLFLLCLTFAAFAEGEMGTGSIADNRSGLTNNTTITKTDDAMTTKEAEHSFFGWLAEIFADVLS